MKKQAFNPYLPSYEYIPDGEPYVFGDRLYVFGSHDRFNGSDFCLNDYVCWSAPVNDLGNWKYEGVIYRKTQDPRATEKSCVYAPDIAQGPDGRYYLYYTLDMTGTIAVAVADAPWGPFSYYGRVHMPNGHVLGDAATDVYQFDPGVLVDDDGRIWLYTGFGSMHTPERQAERFGEHIMNGGYCTELEQDMLTAKSAPVLVIPKKGVADGTEFEAHPFFEASSIRKINGLYYLIYSSSLYHELCYATSRYPNRDFHYGGVVISNGDVGLDHWTKERRANYTGNNHGGMVQIGKQWYIFYHRHTNYHAFSRQGCAEKITIDPNGSIKQVEMTSCGLNHGDLAGTGTYSAAIACNLYAKEGAVFSNLTGIAKHLHPAFTQEGVDREDTESQYITNLRDGSVAGFKYFDLRKTTAIGLTLRGAAGTVTVYDRIGGRQLAQVDFPASSTYQTHLTSVQGGTAHSGLFFLIRTQGSIDLFSFTLK